MPVGKRDNFDLLPMPVCAFSNFPLALGRYEEARTPPVPGSLPPMPGTRLRELVAADEGQHVATGPHSIILFRQISE